MPTPNSDSRDSLLPCPFCGDPDVFFSEVYTDDGTPVENAYQVSCATCQIDISCGDSAKNEIRELYNRRPSSLPQKS